MKDNVGRYYGCVVYTGDDMCYGHVCERGEGGLYTGAICCTVVSREECAVQVSCQLYIVTSLIMSKDDDIKQ